MKQADSSTVQFLLGRFVDTEYQTKLLAKVDQKNFDQLVTNLTERFDWLDLTRADIKEVWKCWFDEAANNGTLIAPELRLASADPIEHDELRLVDLVIELANKHIDALS